MKKSFKMILCLLVTCGFLLSFLTPPCSAVDTSGIGFISEDDDWDDEVSTPQVHDPYEKMNRKMFNFNHKLYKKVFVPISKGYDFIFPKKIQKGINNLFTNIRMPVRLCNNLFQGKFKNAGKEFGRFLVNTTAGIGGLFNPAEAAFDWKVYDEDFGQTLGHYDVGEGPYFVWPIIGPSNARDTVGTILDTAFNPLFWFSALDVVMDIDVVRTLEMEQRINNYSYNIRENYDSLTDNAIDPYIALQHAYVNNRSKKINE
jgi:phospholipid-binding lipoprotein MlaA